MHSCTLSKILQVLNHLNNIHQVKNTFSIIKLHNVQLLCIPDFFFISFPFIISNNHFGPSVEFQAARVWTPAGKLHSDASLGAEVVVKLQEKKKKDTLMNKNIEEKHLHHFNNLYQTTLNVLDWY